MADEYQRGTDQEWLQHSNEELGRMISKVNRRLKLWRTLTLVMAVLLGWVLFKYRQLAPIDTLWRF